MVVELEGKEEGGGGEQHLRDSVGGEEFAKFE